jgi:hypothetical protein
LIEEQMGEGGAYSYSRVQGFAKVRSEKQVHPSKPALNLLKTWFSREKRLNLLKTWFWREKPVLNLLKTWFSREKPALNLLKTWFLSEKPAKMSSKPDFC